MSCDGDVENCCCCCCRRKLIIIVSDREIATAQAAAVLLLLLLLLVLLTLLLLLHRSRFLQIRHQHPSLQRINRRPLRQLTVPHNTAVI